MPPSTTILMWLSLVAILWFPSLPPRQPLGAPSSCSPGKRLLEPLHGLRNPISGSMPYLLLLFLGLCQSLFEKHPRRLIFLRPSMFEHVYILFSHLINQWFDWAQSSRSKSFSPFISWRQLLYCCHVSNVAFDKSHAILLPDLFCGPYLPSLWKVFKSSLLLQVGFLWALLLSILLATQGTFST